MTVSGSEPLDRQRGAPPGWPHPRMTFGVEALMTCPYLKEVAMVFCRACPVKKLVPIDHVTTASRCEGEAYKTCPLFKEALERTYQAAVDTGSSSNEGGAT
jgi:hypothetical protein